GRAAGARRGAAHPSTGSRPARRCARRSARPVRTARRSSCSQGIGRRARAGEDPQVARCAGRKDEVRPLGVPAARWYSLRVRGNGRLSGEPPHMSSKKSLLGSPPSLCASTVGAGAVLGNGIIDLMPGWPAGPVPATPPSPSRSMTVQTVLTDSLEKVLGADAPRPAAPIGGVHASGFLGEVLSLQLALRLGADDPAQLRIALAGEVAGSARVHAVRRVPVSSPAPAEPDEHYLATAPGEYPDLLEPLPDGVVRVERGIWEALWIDLVDAPPGEHDLTLTLAAAEGGQVLAEQVLRLRVHPHRLPPLTITNTHWFHADSLSTHYDVEVFSERHWELIEAFLASAREMDVNSVLTPVWTPPLDTAEGHTRPFVHLVGIREEGGEYSFDLTRLDRWLALCRTLGFTGIEIAHLFTQWGAQHTPAIQVETADGLEHRFGWHVAATDPEYRRLLEALIPALRAHLEAHWDGQVLWHISDEPHEDQLESYRAAKRQVEDLLAGADVVDALSSLAFAEQGVVDTPIVATDHVGPFLEAGRRPWA